MKAASSVLMGDLVKQSGLAVKKQLKKESTDELAFPVFSFCHKLSSLTGKSVSKEKGTVCAAYLDYVLLEIFDLAGREAEDHGCNTVQPRHICFAIRGDRELDMVFKNVTIIGGGVMPYIERGLRYNLEKTYEICREGDEDKTIYTINSRQIVKTLNNSLQPGVKLQARVKGHSPMKKSYKDGDDSELITGKVLREIMPLKTENFALWVTGKPVNIPWCNKDGDGDANSLKKIVGGVPELFQSKLGLYFICPDPNLITPLQKSLPLGEISPSLLQVANQLPNSIFLQIAAKAGCLQVHPQVFGILQQIVTLSVEDIIKEIFTESKQCSIIDIEALLESYDSNDIRFPLRLPLGTGLYYKKALSEIEKNLSTDALQQETLKQEKRLMDNKVKDDFTPIVDRLSCLDLSDELTETDAISNQSEKFNEYDLAIQEIRIQQSSRKALHFPLLGFASLVVEVQKKISTNERDMKWDIKALCLLSEVIVSYLIELLEQVNVLAIHAGRATIMVVDMKIYFQFSRICASGIKY